MYLLLLLLDKYALKVGLKKAFLVKVIVIFHTFS